MSLDNVNSNPSPRNATTPGQQPPTIDVTAIAHVRLPLFFGDIRAAAVVLTEKNRIHVRFV